MGKSKKSNFNHQLKESIDPRFSGLFNLQGTADSKSEPEELQLNVLGYTNKKDNIGFQDFVRTKLFDFLEKNLKEVDRPVLENEIFKSRLEGIQLFSDSNIITELKPREQAPNPHKRKKQKKHKSSEKESLQDVIVTFDFLQHQAKIFNS